MADAEYKRLSLGARLFPQLVPHCSVEGCDGKHYGNGLCNKHYQKNRKYGSPLGVAVRKSKLAPTCQIDGCQREPRSRWQMGVTVCAMHYLRRMQTGSFDDPYADRSPDGLCMADGCIAEVRSSFGQYCEAHYYRIRREQLKGDPRYKDQQRRHQADRRAREVAAFVESVSRAAVMARDRWTCHLCKEKIPKTAKHPDGLFGTLDHVVPLARGGLHSYANIKAAHLSCNCRKNANIVGQLGLEFAR